LQDFAKSKKSGVCQKRKSNIDAIEQIGNRVRQYFELYLTLPGQKEVPVDRTVYMRIK
jgi:hypothetical protein